MAQRYYLQLKQKVFTKKISNKPNFLFLTIIFYTRFLFNYGGLYFLLNLYIFAMIYLLYTFQCVFYYLKFNMNKLFYQCVEIIKYISQISGLTYEEVNIILFVIIHPLLTLLLLIYIIKLRRKLSFYQRKNYI